MKTKMMFSIAAVLALAGTAAAATGTVSVTLKPDKAGKASTLSVTATGPFSFGGLPTSAEFLVQKGFKTSAKSVPTLCSSSQAANGSCPASSTIGSGSAQATGSEGVLSAPDTISFTLYLGSPQQAGDIASVVLSGSDTLLKTPLHATGRLFRTGGGQTELLFSQFPSVSLPPGTTVTLNSLQLSAGAQRTVKKGKGKHKHRVHYALITNPSKCKGQWTGSFTLTFASGTYTKTVSTACKK